MGMPRDLVLVRHGQSEANIVQKMYREPGEHELPQGFLNRHDTNMRLTPLGVMQAKAAGEWLRREFPHGFDHYYTSTLLRTRETAGYLGLGGPWIKDDRLRERDWGEINSVGDETHRRLYPGSYRLWQQNKWYWCPPGGESLATDVRLRWERILNTMHREMDGHTYIGVGHGDLIEVARVIFERLQIDEWLEQQSDPVYAMQNCQILHYTRINPKTGEDAGKLLWRRSMCPWDDSKSWFSGQWVELVLDRQFSNAELLAEAEDFPLLFPELKPDNRLLNLAA
jgi:broad specificity phosphatase PhoE